MQTVWPRLRTSAPHYPSAETCPGVLPKHLSFPRAIPPGLATANATWDSTSTCRPIFLQACPHLCVRSSLCGNDFLRLFHRVVSFYSCPKSPSPFQLPLFSGSRCCAARSVLSATAWLARL